MILWLAFGAMVALAVALPLAALMRARASEDRLGREMALYRQQLAELAEEQAAGMIDPGQASAARLEIERRMLRADAETGRSGPTGRGASRGLVTGVLVLAVLASLVGYGLLGQPSLPGKPAESAASATPAETSRTAAEGEASIEILIARLAARLEDSPERTDGWRLLGRTALNSGRPKLAAEAFRRAAELAPENAAFHSALGEALVAMAEGRVTPAAVLAFRSARERAPDNPAAGYYLGLAAMQEGDTEAALARWREVLANTPENAPWRENLRQQVAQVARSLAAPAAQSAAPALDSEAMAAAEGMDPAARQRMIAGMVDRLANRLESNPEDYQGWLRLARARMVLGETQAARDALKRALAAAPADLEDEITAEIDRLSEQ